MKRSIRIAIPYAILISSAVVVPGCHNESNNPVTPGGGRMTFGSTTVIYSGTVSTSASRVVVSRSGDPLNGLAIDVPAGAFRTTQSLSLTSAPVQSHLFGEDFEPITPALFIDPGSVYADRPLVVTIPAKIPANHFAMAFAYNPITDKLEPLPVLAETDTSVTTYLGDFAAGTGPSGLLDRMGFRKPGGQLEFLLGLVLSVIASEVLDLSADYPSGFWPGVDDWQFTNYGSIIAPGGHCAGQCTSAMWYFFNRRAAGQPALHDRYDNDGLTPATPNLQEDDVLGYKLSSVVQNDANWENVVTDITYLLSQQPLGDIFTMKAFTYALRVTQQPQLVAIFGTNQNGKAVGHAMIVYRQNNNELCVADPNHPGVPTCSIKFVGSNFQSYYSGLTASDPGMFFDKIALFRYQSPFFNWNSIADRWKEFDAKTIGTGIFPAYEVRALNDSGEYVPLTDGFKSEENELTLSIKSSVQLDFEVYDESCAMLPLSGSSVALPNGKQRVGVCCRAVNGRWAGFNWYSVEMGPNAADTSSLIPLTTGNTWTYAQRKYRENGTMYESGSYTQTIVDAEFIGNDKWFLFAEQHGSSIDTLYLTRRYDGVWVLPVGTAYPEFMLFQFPVSAGASYASGIDGLTEMTVTNTALAQTVPAGNFPQCYVYKQQTLGRTDYNERVLCPGVGEVASRTYSAKTGGGTYISVVSELTSYTIK